MASFLRTPGVLSRMRSAILSRMRSAILATTQSAVPGQAQYTCSGSTPGVTRVDAEGRAEVPLGKGVLNLAYRPSRKLQASGKVPCHAKTSRGCPGLLDRRRPIARIGRAGDADPGSLLRRRRRDSALPEARIPPRPAGCSARARRPSYGIPTPGGFGTACNTSLVLRSLDREASRKFGASGKLRIAMLEWPGPRPA